MTLEQVIGNGAADPRRYSSQGGQHKFSSHVIPEKRGLLSCLINYWSHWTHVHKSCFNPSWNWWWWYYSWWGIMRNDILTWCNTAYWNPESLCFTALSLLFRPPLSACIQSYVTLQWMLLSYHQCIATWKKICGEDGRREGPVRDNGIALNFFSLGQYSSPLSSTAFLFPACFFCRASLAFELYASQSYSFW